VVENFPDDDFPPTPLDSERWSGSISGIARTSATEFVAKTGGPSEGTLVETPDLGAKTHEPLANR
jgi:hypothetical protein